MLTNTENTMQTATAADWIVSKITWTTDARTQGWRGTFYPLFVEGHLSSGIEFAWRIPMTSILNERYDLSRASMSDAIVEALREAGRVQGVEAR